MWGNLDCGNAACALQRKRHLNDLNSTLLPSPCRQVSLFWPAEWRGESEKDGEGRASREM